MTPELPVHLRQGRPRYGWVLREEEPKSERAKTIEKFGERANERSGDRRVRGMTPEEVKQWLKHNGINDGVDRRKAERRRR